MLKERGYTFDLGPSILTLPHIFERLFERSGKKMSDYIPIRTLRPHWRNFFEDGKVVDLDPDAAYNERKNIYKAHGLVVRTKAVVQTVEGDKNGLWTTCVAAAVLIPY